MRRTCLRAFAKSPLARPGAIPAPVIPIPGTDHCRDDRPYRHGAHRYHQATDWHTASRRSW